MSENKHAYRLVCGCIGLAERGLTPEQGSTIECALHARQPVAGFGICWALLQGENAPERTTTLPTQQQELRGAALR
jgi:hypothetical protein